jgi:SAM-dependent methyltransferase
LNPLYGEDLAHIHDRGFTGMASANGPALIRLLHRYGVDSGRVADLGCGSGVWLRQLSEAGYEATGIDASADMLGLARLAAPQADLVLGSVYDVPLPRCVAVTAFGEVLNYTPSAENIPPLEPLFDKVFVALEKGGVFLFDVIEPCSEPVPPRRSFQEGEDWAVLVEVIENDNLLERRITSFRRAGDLYRRTHEVHFQRLVPTLWLRERLERAGFEVEASHPDGIALLPRRVLFICRKNDA